MPKNITLQFIPYATIAYLSSYQRVKLLIDLTSENKILLVQGKLSPQEETDLISETMKRIGKSKRFKGIELTSFIPKVKHLTILQNMVERLASTFGNRDILTVIGPATIVREIRKDPTKIQLFLRK